MIEKANLNTAVLSPASSSASQDTSELFKSGWLEKKGKKRFLILIDYTLYWFEKELVNGRIWDFWKFFLTHFFFLPFKMQHRAAQFNTSNKLHQMEVFTWVEVAQFRRSKTHRNLLSVLQTIPVRNICFRRKVKKKLTNGLKRFPKP